MFRKITWFAMLLVLIWTGTVISGTIQLPRTGQTKCYNKSGASIPCTGTGQDGEFQAGVAWPVPRFTVNGDCVTDNLTGLMWAKNGNLPGSPLKWDEAIDYANNLSLCSYSDWRLPNINELESLHHAGKSDTGEWLMTQGFTNINLFDWYWSSTTRSDAGRVAWIVDMYGCSVYDGGNKDYDQRYVWPVRGESTGSAQLWQTGQVVSYRTRDDGDLRKGASWPVPRFTVDGECVTDDLTGLMWAMNANLLNGKNTWSDVLNYANNLSLCSYSDWRLPNRKELMSLIDRSHTVPALPDGHPFLNVQTDPSSSLYWSSTTEISDKIHGIDVYMGRGQVDSAPKDSVDGFVWPVRGGGPFRVTLLSPNGGETLFTGSDVLIEWGAPSEVVNYKLKYSIDNGVTWTSIGTGFYTGTSTTWTVPYLTKNATECKVKVIGYNVSNEKVGSDMSDGPFTIEVLTVDSPKPGDTCYSGQTCTIAWTAHRAAATIKLSYSADGGTTWKTIPASLTGSDTIYPWIAPPVKKAKSKCKVKVILKDDTGGKVGSDTSDGYFTIQP
jgi:hypothetical protein